MTSLKKIIVTIALLVFAAIAAYHAIWAQEIRDRELKGLERFHGRDSRIFRFSSKLMGSSYVFSFRLVGSVSAILLLALAIYVAIHGFR